MRKVYGPVENREELFVFDRKVRHDEGEVVGIEVTFQARAEKRGR